MSLKTDCVCYNEDNFVEEDGQIHELTVEITLGEYRNLISEITRQDILIDRLTEEKNELQEKLTAVTNALAACEMPKWIKAVGKALAGEENEETENETENNEPV